MKATSSSPRSAFRLPVALALALGGCTLFDTRPAVEILPGGDLVGGFTTQLRVEAGGAPEARILVDGKALGGPIPTGVDVRVDTSTVPEGMHELVVRVEQSPAPRTSAPRRLEIRKFGYRVPVELVQKSSPWEPVVFEVRSPDPIATVTASAYTTSRGSLPCDPPVPSADRRTWTVAVAGWTLKELGSVVVAGEVTDDMGLHGRAQAQFTMPSRIAVTFQQPSGAVTPPVRVVASPAVRVPSATLWASSLTQPSFRVRDVGPSPWDVTLGENEIWPGTYTFEFRRDDVVLEGRATVTVGPPTVRPSCSVERWAPTVTSERCGVVTFAAPPSAARLEGTAFGEPWPGDLFLLPLDARSWRICPSSSRWKRGPVSFTATAVAIDTGNAVLERVSCSFTMGWEWSAAGGEPVADGEVPVVGRVLAVRDQAGGATRIALLGSPSDFTVGPVRIGERGPTAGSFTFSGALTPGVAADAVADLESWTAIAWIPAQGVGVATGLLERSLGAGFAPWPLAEDATRATHSPAIASAADGPAVVAWVEEAPDRTSVIRVRAQPPLWTLLPPIAAEVPQGRVESPSVAPSGPLGSGLHLAFLEVSPPSGAQRVRLVAWDGTTWVPWPAQFPAIPATARNMDPARVILSSDRSRAWVHVFSLGQGLRAFTWTAGAPGAWTEEPILLDPQGGSVRGNAVAVGLPFDGRPPVAAITFTRPDGQAEVRICPSPSGRDCVSLGPVGGAPHRAIALDPFGMTVAWTAIDGTVHMRTLTP